MKHIRVWHGFILIFLVVFLWFFLTSHQLKKELRIFMDYPIHDEKYYTTASYENYRSAFQEAQEIQEKWLAWPSSVGRSKQKLQDALDCLAETTQGVYRIDWEFNLQFNNFVGSDWHHEIFCDGKPWHQGDTITANPNSYVTVRGVVQEIDKISDCGEEMLQLMLAEDVSDSVLIKVTKAIRTCLKAGSFGTFHPIYSCKASALLRLN